MLPRKRLRVELRYYIDLRRATCHNERNAKRSDLASEDGLFFTVCWKCPVCQLQLNITVMGKAKESDLFIRAAVVTAMIQRTKLLFAVKCVERYLQTGRQPVSLEGG